MSSIQHDSDNDRVIITIDAEGVTDEIRGYLATTVGQTPVVISLEHERMSDQLIEEGRKKMRLIEAAMNIASSLHWATVADICRDVTIDVQAAVFREQACFRVLQKTQRPQQRLVAPAAQYRGRHHIKKNKQYGF